MNELNKSAFFAAAARPRAVFTLEGYGEVPIQALTIQDRTELPVRIDEDQAEALVWAVCQGVEGLTQDDLEQVAAMSPDAIGAISSAIFELSGLGEDEDAEKNDLGPTGSSVSRIG